MIHICRATRGRYGMPHKIEANTIRTPKKSRCQDPQHEGKQKYFLTADCYYQEWELTEKEAQEAIDSYDMFSLDMPVRIICPRCAEINEISQALKGKENIY